MTKNKKIFLYLIPLIIFPLLFVCCQVLKFNPLIDNLIIFYYFKVKMKNLMKH